MIAYSAPAGSTVLHSVKRTVYAFDDADSFKRHLLHSQKSVYKVINALGLLLGDLGGANTPTPEDFIRADIRFFSMYGDDYYDICSQQQLIPKDYTLPTDREMSAIEILLLDAFHWQKTPFTDAELKKYTADLLESAPLEVPHNGVFSWGYTIIKLKD